MKTITAIVNNLVSINEARYDRPDEAFLTKFKSMMKKIGEELIDAKVSSKIEYLDLINSGELCSVDMTLDKIKTNTTTVSNAIYKILEARGFTLIESNGTDITTDMQFPAIMFLNKELGIYIGASVVRPYYGEPAKIYLAIYSEVAFDDN